METEINKLRRLNIIAGTLHLVSLIGILLLSNDAALPVNATYLTEAPGTGNFSAPINLFNLNISYMVAAFLALSAFFHFFISTKSTFAKYSAGLRNNINVFRWVEYSISSSLMIIVILQLNGTADYIALLGIFGVNVCMILFGWLQSCQKERRLESRLHLQILLPHRNQLILILNLDVVERLIRTLLNVCNQNLLMSMN